VTDSVARPFSVRVFLPGGDPDGVRVIEKTNWSGIGVVIPRPLLGESKGRPEMDRTAVYVLVGPGEDSPLPRVYIGEADVLRPRLVQHQQQNGKDFWTHAVAFTSKDANLNKAHVKHLESRLVELAKASKQCVLENSTAPGLPSLSEADAAEAEGFLADLLLCFPILGYGFFEQAPQQQTSTKTLFLRAKGITAEGFESSRGFVVRAGSTAVGEAKEAASCHAYLIETRRELVRQGVFTAKGDGFEVTQDYTFSSPSTASGVLLGKSSNGRVEWKAADGRTLKDIQDAENE